MGSREVPFDPEEICDLCGKKGAYDYMGDLICPACAKEAEEDAPTFSPPQDGQQK